MVNTYELLEGLVFGDNHSYKLLSDVKKLNNYKTINSNPHVKKMIEDLRNFATDNPAFPMLTFSKYNEFSLTGKRLPYENTYYTRLKALYSMSAVTILEQTNSYIEKIEDMLWEICNQYTWASPAHMIILKEVEGNPWSPETLVDLNSAEIGFFLSEMFIL
jgi:hypothetical protein